MLSNNERKMIASLAKSLQVPFKQAHDFYREICLRLEPSPSVQLFVDYFGDYGNINTSISEFVDIILKRQKSMRKIPHSDGSLAREKLTIRQLDWRHKAATARHLRLTTIPEAKEAHVNKGLQQMIAPILPKESKNDLDAAKVFLTDMQRIHPQFMERLDLFLAAVKRCSRRNKLTVDEVWETMWEISNPSLEKPQIISTPMGGKK